MDGQVTWLWIPITIAAAFCQNLRTALQKHLRGQLSTNGSTFTRYVFGCPLVIVYAIGLHVLAGLPWPSPNPIFAGWVVVGAATQIVATSLLIYLFSFRNFAVGVTYSKTEVIQAAIFGLVFLGDSVTLWGGTAIAIGTAGVMLISLTGAGDGSALLQGLAGPAALIGLASGGLFGIAAVAFRAAALSLDGGFVMTASYTLLCANLLQTAMMAAYLWRRERDQFGKLLKTWRVSALTGVIGVIGSALWFMAMTIQLVAYVRTLGLIELVFTFLFSWFFFKERPLAAELAGIALLLVGIAMALNLR
jgi:drug/metabolite transporter (DMT)-like permease